MKMFSNLCLLFIYTGAFGMSKENIPPNVSPEYLDRLLKDQRYDEFSYLMGLESPELAKPNKEIPGVDPMLNENLFEGDIVMKPWQKEQQRQGIRFDRNPGSRWPNKPGEPSMVPYTISAQFTGGNREIIINAINEWNARAQCVKFTPRSNEADYVNIFSGRGCYANLGRTGGQQSLSLGPGCVRHAVVLHEMEHTIGIHHEHNRNDRDEFVRVLWRNIPPNWWSQYRRTNPDQYGLQSNYDYYSVMHYPMRAPVTGRDAFRILKPGIDRNQIGQRRGFSDTDLEKIRILYCSSAT